MLCPFQSKNFNFVKNDIQADKDKKEFGMNCRCAMFILVKKFSINELISF